ncbi:toprim domain-containing protein (plasmid) [Serratia ureilytica]
MVLGVSEGIENALSVTEATSIPCWASSSSTFMEMLEIPEYLMPPSDCQFIELSIWADKDRVNPNTGNSAGESAARVLKSRMEPYLLNAILKQQSGLRFICLNWIYLMVRRCRLE